MYANMVIFMGTALLDSLNSSSTTERVETTREFALRSINDFIYTWSGLGQFHEKTVELGINTKNLSIAEKPPQTNSVNHNADKSLDRKPSSDINQSPRQHTSAAVQDFPAQHNQSATQMDPPKTVFPKMDPSDFAFYQQISRKGGYSIDEASAILDDLVKSQSALINPDDSSRVKEMIRIMKAAIQEAAT